MGEASTLAGESHVVPLWVCHGILARDFNIHVLLEQELLSSLQVSSDLCSRVAFKSHVERVGFLEVTDGFRDLGTVAGYVHLSLYMYMYIVSLSINASVCVYIYIWIYMMA